MNDADWDLSLKKGQLGERFTQMILTDTAKVEVKTEIDSWYDSKAIFIEIRSDNKPSGLSVTSADWWFTNLSITRQDKLVFCGSKCVPVDALKRFIVTKYKDVKTMRCGYNNLSEGWLIPLKDIDDIIFDSASLVIAERISEKKMWKQFLKNKK